MKVYATERHRLYYAYSYAIKGIGLFYLKHVICIFKMCDRSWGKRRNTLKNRLRSKWSKKRPLLYCSLLTYLLDAIFIRGLSIIVISGKESSH